MSTTSWCRASTATWTLSCRSWAGRCGLEDERGARWGKGALSCVPGENVLSCFVFYRFFHACCCCCCWLSFIFFVVCGLCFRHCSFDEFVKNRALSVAFWLSCAVWVCLCRAGFCRVGGILRVGFVHRCPQHRQRPLRLLRLFGTTNHSVVCLKGKWVILRSITFHFFIFFCGSSRAVAWKSKVIARMRELVAGIWEEAKVEMYGSCYTGEEGKWLPGKGGRARGEGGGAA